MFIACGILALIVLCILGIVVVIIDSFAIYPESLSLQWPICTEAFNSSCKLFTVTLSTHGLLSVMMISSIPCLSNSFATSHETNLPPWSETVFPLTLFAISSKVCVHHQLQMNQLFLDRCFLVLLA